MEYFPGVQTLKSPGGVQSDGQALAPRQRIPRADSWQGGDRQVSDLPHQCGTAIRMISVTRKMHSVLSVCMCACVYVCMSSRINVRMYDQ